VRRAHFACLALFGIVAMLAIRSTDLPSWLTVIAYPLLCVGTMVVGMRALDRDKATSSEEVVDSQG
jgi:hypothetical protein